MKSMALGVHMEDVWGAKLEGAGGAEERSCGGFSAGLSCWLALGEDQLEDSGLPSEGLGGVLGFFGLSFFASLSYLSGKWI